MLARRLPTWLVALCLAALVQTSTEAQQNKKPKAPAPKAPAPKPKQATPKKLVDLAPLLWEVKALQELHSLGLKPDQLRALSEVAKQTGGRLTPIQGSEELRKALIDLKAALVNKDEENIHELEAKLDDLQEAEEADLDQEPELKAAAKAAAPKLLLSLTVDQIKAFISDHDEEVADPVDLIQKALEEGRGVTREEWLELRNETAATVAQLVAGFKHEKVQAQVTAFLDKAHRLNDQEYKAKHKELGQEAKQIVAVATPLEIIQHGLERGLAKLLSNPRLAAAIEDRLKHPIEANE